MWRFAFTLCVMVCVASTRVAARPAEPASALSFSYEVERRPQDSGLLNATRHRRLYEDSTCAATCTDESCDFWHMGGGTADYECSELEDVYGCDCSGCNTCSCSPKDDYIRVKIMDSYGDGA